MNADCSTSPHGLLHGERACWEGGQVLYFSNPTSIGPLLCKLARLTILRYTSHLGVDFSSSSLKPYCALRASASARQGQHSSQGWVLNTSLVTAATHKLELARLDNICVIWFTSGHAAHDAAALACCSVRRLMAGRSRRSTRVMAQTVPIK